MYLNAESYVGLVCTCVKFRRCIPGYVIRKNHKGKAINRLRSENGISGLIVKKIFIRENELATADRDFRCRAAVKSNE